MPKILYKSSARVFACRIVIARAYINNIRIDRFGGKRLRTYYEGENANRCFFSSFIFLALFPLPNVKYSNDFVKTNEIREKMRIRFAVQIEYGGRRTKHFVGASDKKKQFGRLAGECLTSGRMISEIVSGVSFRI